MDPELALGSRASLLLRMRMCLQLGGILGLGLAAFAAAAGEPIAPAITGFGAWAPRPPLGWDSGDAFGDSVTEKEVMANAHYLHDHLLKHGFNTVVIGGRWYDPAAHSSDLKDAVGAKLAMDEFGRLQPAESRFPSASGGKGFAPLAQSIHGLGLKFGIRVMRGIPRRAAAANHAIEGSALTAALAADPNSVCNWNPDMYGVQGDSPAGQAWYDSILRQYAAWGVDCLAVDDLANPFRAAELRAIRRAIDRCGRPVTLSIGPGEISVTHASDVEIEANQWRITPASWDQWASVEPAFDRVDAWKGREGPGHWLDAGTIPFGHIGLRNRLRGPDRPTRLTRDEQMTVLTLWSLASSPLILGMNLPDNDPWLQSLLTNDEMLAIDQDPLGKPALRAVNADAKEVWVKELANGDKAFGYFNRTDQPAQVVIFWPEAGLTGPCWVRDVWNREVRAEADRGLEVQVEPHGAVLLKLHQISVSSVDEGVTKHP
jgi:alpha-galactosidase